jgi:hypothetical protein
MRKFNPVRFGCQVFTVFLLFLILPNQLYAQAASGDAVWIFFAQKNSSVPVSFPEATRDRRLLRASMQDPVWYDLPVDKAYIDGLVSSGASVRIVSR